MSGLVTPYVYLLAGWVENVLSKTCFARCGVVAKRIRAPNSSSGASVQQCVGSNPGRDTCVPEQDT